MVSGLCFYNTESLNHYQKIYQKTYKEQTKDISKEYQKNIKRQTIKGPISRRPMTERKPTHNREINRKNNNNK